MKKMLCMILAVLMLALAGCGGDVSEVGILQWEPSQLYTDGEIEAAIDVVLDYFEEEFEGCKLTEVSYCENAAEFQEWAEQYGTEEAIVLYSSFEVDASGGDGSLNPNSTYRNWKWVLVRDGGGSWRHVTHGYG